MKKLESKDYVMVGVVLVLALCSVVMFIAVTIIVNNSWTVSGDASSPRVRQALRVAPINHDDKAVTTYQLQPTINGDQLQ